ncbi:hypothetical protein ABIE44_001777 [Marmoricola sp. OAE513]|uniref:Imm51 family immunity protein n=1 Tax=Marmoricola sp. OAE513 TaxID=2817894 RepID=UPI001AE47AF4
MGDLSKIEKFVGEYSLSFECRTPVDDVVREQGDEPNGHFWETVAEFLAPVEFAELEPDSEGSMFSVSGKKRHLRRLQKRLEPVLQDPVRLREVLAAAKAAGFQIEG